MSSHRIIAVAALLLSLAACGFQPVYADKAYRLSAPASGSTDITDDLARVRMLPFTETIGSSTLESQTGRGGQKLQNLLIDRMYPNGYPKQPAYTLDIALTTTENRLGIQKDSSATRAELIMTANLILKRALGAPAPSALRKNNLGDEAYRTTVRTRVSYNILDAQYGTLAARENAIDRGLEQIANETVTRLSLFFSRDPDAVKAVPATAVTAATAATPAPQPALQPAQLAQPVDLPHEGQ